MIFNPILTSKTGELEEKLEEMKRKVATLEIDNSFIRKQLNDNDALIEE